MKTKGIEVYFDIDSKDLDEQLYNETKDFLNTDFVIVNKDEVNKENITMKTKQRYTSGDIIKDDIGYCTIIRYYPYKGYYYVYNCDNNGIPSKPPVYREVKHNDIIELIHG